MSSMKYIVYSFSVWIIIHDSNRALQSSYLRLWGGGACPTCFAKFVLVQYSPPFEALLTVMMKHLIGTHDNNLGYCYLCEGALHLFGWTYSTNLSGITVDNVAHLCEIFQCTCLRSTQEHHPPLLLTPIESSQQFFFFFCFFL